MDDESDDPTEWSRQKLLEMGAAPAIRGAVLPHTERETGTLTKKV